MKNKLAKLSLPLLLVGMFLLFGVAFNANSAQAASGNNRCLLGPGLTNCTPYDAQIRAAGYNPADLAKCYVIQNQTVTQEDCTRAPFNMQPGQTIDEGLQQQSQQDAAQQATESVDAQIRNPQRDSCNSTASCIDNNPLIQTIIVAINFLSAAVGVVVIIVIVIAGIQYSTAGGNPNATSAAKKRILNAIIALVAYMLLFMFLQWVIPGGLL